MKIIRIITNTVLAFFISGCSTLSTKLPAITTENPGPIEVATSYDRLVINTTWKNGIPLGPGKLDWYIRYPSGEALYSKCNATFQAPEAAIQPDTAISRMWSARDAFKYDGTLYGSGEIVSSDGKLIYKGQLSANTKKAEGCKPEGHGEFFREDGWRVSGVFTSNGSGFMYIHMYDSLHSPQYAPRSMRRDIGIVGTGADHIPTCFILDKGGIERWRGRCSSYRTENGSSSRVAIDLFSPLEIAQGEGILRNDVGDQIDLEIDATTRAPKDGPARLTSSDGTAWKVFFRGGQIAARHLAPESITSKAIKGCSPWQGFTAVEGRCNAGRWNGTVQAYSADGERRISGQFANGTPQGDLEYSELSTGVRIRGHAATGGGAFGFTQGRLYQAGVMTYDGLFSGVQPNGRGTCVYQGTPESCEYYNGARVDALYKTRQDNERTQLAQEKARQQQVQARQQQAQAQARQSKDSNWGLKAMVIGGVAAIAGNSGIAIDKQVEIVSNVATDVLSDGKTSNTSNMLSNQQQEVINKSSASAASDKKPASVSNNAASNRGQINSVAKACNRQVGAIVSLNSKQQYTEAAEACKSVAPQGFVWGTDSGEGNGSAEGSCKKAVHEAYDGKYAKTACYCYQDHNPGAYSALSPGSWICWVGEGG